MNIYDHARFPFLAELEANYAAIRAEAEKLIVEHFKPYPFLDVYTAGWSTLELYYHDNRKRVSERPRLTISDCKDPFGLFFALFGDRDALVFRLFVRHLPEGTLEALSKISSPNDAPPELVDNLIAAGNALVQSQDLFVEHQRAITLGSQTPRSSERLEGLLQRGVMRKVDGRYELVRATERDDREALSWFHIALLEEVLLPGLIVKGGVMEFQDMIWEAPVTSKIASSIRGHRSVWFSCLAPNAHILPHTGNDDTMLRCHLALIVPGECALKVGAPLLSQNDFVAWDEILKVLSADDLRGGLLRDAMTPELRQFFVSRTTLREEEDQEAVWKALTELSERLNLYVTRPGFALRPDVRGLGAGSAFAASLAKLEGLGAVVGGQLAPDAAKDASLQNELEWLNTTALVEGVFPMFLGKDPHEREQIIRWEEGKSFVFDDTQYHEAWNKADRNRVVLAVDIDKATYS